MATIDQYLMTLVNYLSIGDEERKHRLDAFGALRTAILSRMPQVTDVLLFGSFARGTNLSMDVDPTSDTDALVVIPESEYLKLARNKALLNELQTRLSELDCVVGQTSPSVSLTYLGFSFDLFPAMQTKRESEGFIFSGPFTAWHAENAELLADERFDFATPGVVEAGIGIRDEDREMVAFTTPIAQNAILEEYDRSYGPAWRGTILLLKYWKFARSLSLEHEAAQDGPWSFVLEESIMYALDDYGRTVERFASPIDFMHHTLARTELYPFDLLSKLDGFHELRQTLERLAGAQEPRTSPKLFALVTSLFPVPPEPVTFTSKSALESLRTQLARVSMYSFVREHARAVEIILTTCAAVANDPSREVAALASDALLQAGSVQEGLQQPQASANTYRTVVARYRDAPWIELRRVVMQALEKEMRIYQMAGDSPSALDCYERALATFAETTDEDGVNFVAATLYNKALTLYKLEELSSARQVCRQAESKFDGATIDGLTSTMVQMHLIAAQMAGEQNDLVEALRLYTKIDSASDRVSALEVTAMVVWALFERGLCLIKLNRRNEAEQVLDALVARYAAATEHDEPVGCARVLRAITGVEAGENGALTMLATLLKTYDAHEGRKIRRWVSLGGQYL